MKIFYLKSLSHNGITHNEKRVDWTFGSRFCASTHRPLPNPYDLDTEYDLVYSDDTGKPLTERDLETVFHDFQGEFMPDHVMDQVLAKFGRSHTSMSVGDIVLDHGKMWMVDSMGFKPLCEEIYLCERCGRFDCVLECLEV